MEQKEMKAVPEDRETVAPEKCPNFIVVIDTEPKRELVDSNKVVTFDDLVRAIREHKSTVEWKQVEQNQQFARETEAYGPDNTEPTEPQTPYQKTCFDYFMDCLCISWCL